MAEMSNELILSCELCTHKYTNYTELRMHYKRKHPQKNVLQCPLCAYLTINNMDIKQHRKIHHPGKKFVCSQCGFSSKRWSKWKEHLEVGHQREKDLARTGSELSVGKMNIDVPLNNFPDRKNTEVADILSDLLSHKSVSCTECDRQYTRYEKLKKHFKKRHGDLEIQQCPFCQFVTPTAKALSEHKRLSHREMVICCLDCDFSTKKWLKWNRHLIGTKHRIKQSETQTLSSPERKLQCLNCGYASHSYKGLKKHYHKHHKEQVVFECPFCDYVTVESPEMKHHKKTSHPQEQICCSLCDFTTRKWIKWIYHQENGHLKTTDGNISQMIFSQLTDNQLIDKYGIHFTKPISDNFEDNLNSEAQDTQLPNTCIAQSTEVQTSQLAICKKSVKLKPGNIVPDSGRLSVSDTSSRDLTVIQHTEETVGKCNNEQPADSEVHRVESRLSVASGTAGSSDKGNDVRPFVCETCQKSFKTRYDLKRHVMTVHSNVRNYTCSECSKTFKTLTQLNQHRLIHSDVRNYICGECSKSFKTVSDLNHHKVVHSDVRNYVCNECKKAFKSITSLNRHKLIHADLRKYICSECDKTFKTRGALQNHKVVHLNVNCFKCSQCDFATRRKREFTDHMNRHLGIKPYRCTFCDKSYTSNKCLRLHIRAHTEEWQYKCQYCDYTVFTYNRYKRHLGIHLNIKPYKCADCDFSSTHKENLEAHMRTHTGEKPFVCPVCGKCFSRKHDMQRHIVAIHFKDSK